MWAEPATKRLCCVHPETKGRAGASRAAFPGTLFARQHGFSASAEPGGAP